VRSVRAGDEVALEFDRLTLACERSCVNVIPGARRARRARRAQLAATAAGCVLTLGMPPARASDAQQPSGQVTPARPAMAKPAVASRGACAARTPDGVPAGSPGRSQAGAGPPGVADQACGRNVDAAGAPFDDALGAESAELRSLREAERVLFPSTEPAPGSWPSDLPRLPEPDGSPLVQSSGLPPAPRGASRSVEPVGDLAWLARLELPDLPVRWDERVIRYLEYFRDDPRGHMTFAALLRRSGRYRAMMTGALRRRLLPEDLVWVAMVESGFDPTARSMAGAAGLWQFMPKTAKVHGLTVDHWLDERYNADLATEAAAELLGESHRSFGTWELAIASFNMGYAGLVSVLRRFNSNDFWSLSRAEGSLPWETTLYVPKVLAVAVVARNLSAFGFGDAVLDSPVAAETVDVPPGTPLSLVAQAARCDPRDIETLNPELRASRTPPLDDVEGTYPVSVPSGKGASTAQALARLRRGQPPLDRYVVRFGETLDLVAATHKTTAQKLADINGISAGEAIRGGTTLLVPKVDAALPAPSASPPVPLGDGPSPQNVGSATPPLEPSRVQGPPPKQSVVVPADEFVYPDRRRFFYRVVPGDTLGEVAAALRVSADDLRRWNVLDPAARLQAGMTLQAFVGAHVDLSGVVVIPESDVRVLAVGSDEFFAWAERDRGFKRIAVAAKAGDTIESIGKRFDVSARTMERVNRRGRSEALKAGENVVVYIPSRGSGSAFTAAGRLSAVAAGESASNAAVPNGPLPDPPLPDILPSP
jgi:membrane-bound lytic murein transglycosylase D